MIIQTYTVVCKLKNLEHLLHPYMNKPKRTSKDQCQHTLAKILQKSHFKTFKRKTVSLIHQQDSLFKKKTLLPLIA